MENANVRGGVRNITGRPRKRKTGGDWMAAIELEHVYLQRGNFIMRDIDFAVEQNEIVALIGRSGAGKTSLIRLIAGSCVPDAGWIRYFGEEMCDCEAKIRREMSVVFDTPNFNTEMKAIRLAKEIQKFEPWFDMDFFRENLKRMGLEESKRVRQYSKGMQKLYMLILMLSRQPKLLVMDEPTGGLDEESRKEMIRMIQEYRKEHPLTVLFSTHNRADVEEFADRCIRIEEGGMG